MGTITRTTKAGGGTNFNAGQTIDPAEVNTDFNTAYTEINGLLNDANLADLTVPGANALRFTKRATPANPTTDQIYVYALSGTPTTRLEARDSAGTILQYGGVLNRTVTATTVANTTTETTVYSYSVPANTLGTNRMLRLTLQYDMLDNSGVNDGHIVRGTFGGTIFGETQFNSVASASRAAGIITAELVAANATNAQIGTLRDTRPSTPIGVAGNRATNDCTPALSMHNALALDSTAAQTLAITIQWGTASTTRSTIVRTAILELV